MNFILYRKYILKKVQKEFLIIKNKIHHKKENLIFFDSLSKYLDRLLKNLFFLFLESFSDSTKIIIQKIFISSYNEDFSTPYSKKIKNMLKIRFKRAGRKKRDFFQIVVAENLSRRDGKAVAELGYYDPIRKKSHIRKTDLFKYLENGARPTNSVRHLIEKLIQKENEKN